MIGIKSRLGMASAVALCAGCVAVPPPEARGTNYECDRGTRLQVDYIGQVAFVRVNGARAKAFRQTPSNEGETYENGPLRLSRNGNVATWSTARRSAPETCRVLNTIT